MQNMNSTFSKIIFAILAITYASTFSSCKDDNDGSPAPLDLPVLHISDVTVEEGDEDQVINLEVTLTGDNTTNAIVTLSGIEGSAETPDDYTMLTTGKLQFAPGETTKLISIRIKADEGKEPTESFEVKLYNPQNCKIEHDLSVITI